MDKKELQNLIDRISLTGPGGVDKIKKILKELANGSSSDGGGTSDSDIQIVELTYDHIPATGTLSASDLAKLDSDNCLLVMKGKYFRKTFSSSGGIDYKEIGLTTVLGGVRSIYFTASKPDGEYTIAYTYPIEANTQKTQATTSLKNIRVGNTTYSVPAVINVPGVFNGLHFTPVLDTEPGKQVDTSAQAALWHEVADAFKNGAVVNLVSDGNYHRVISLESFNSGGVAMQFLTVISMNAAASGESSSLCGWLNPETLPPSTPSEPAH